jgi:Flp pilus assembly protein TadG
MSGIRGERGQGLVELSLLLPILLVVALGAVDLGRVYFAYVAVVNAAREGAFYAALNPSAGAAAVQAVVDAETAGQLAGGARVVGLSADRSPGAELTVTVEHEFRALTTAVVGGRTVPVRASAAVVVQ